MSSYSVLHDFSNMGFVTPGRSFAGFPKARHGTARVMAPRDVARVEMKPGDLLSLAGAWSEGALLAVAFDPQGGCGLSRLGLPADAALNPGLADCAEMTGWIASQGGDVTATLKAATAKGAHLIITVDCRL